MDEDQEIIRDFVSESSDLLDEIEQKLVTRRQAEGSPAAPDSELINSIFRLFHSMKGTSAMLAFQNLASLTHKAETALEPFRKGKAVLSPAPVDTLLKTLDLIRKMLEQVSRQGQDRGFEGAVQPLLAELAGLAEPRENPVARAGAEIQSSPEIRRGFMQDASEALEQTEGILLALEKNWEPEGLAGAYRNLHSLKGNCGMLGLAEMERLCHELESRLGTMQAYGMPIAPADLAALLPQMDRLHQALSDMEKENTPAPKKPEIASGENSAPAPASVRQDIRVDLQKLDTLVNLVGELVIAEAMLTRHPLVREINDEEVERAVHQLRRVSQELQDVAMSARMVPLTSTFQKMNRLVHDLSRKSGKRVELQLLGEDTEVDKSVIEHIADPLVHIVRNAIDHGLETLEARRAFGKSETGKLVIEGRHEGNEVWITVRDDGQGLNREKILSKAIEKGLVPPEMAGLTEKQIYKLIFEPGFSTAEKVTEISGRGVGMDVVKRNIEKIKGRVEVRSNPGQGSAFIMRIPLTLAIIDGMLIRVGDGCYTIPMLAIRESIQPRPEQILTTPDGKEVIRVRGDFFPILRLHKLFQKQAGNPVLSEGLVILVEDEGQPLGLFCDEICGQQDIVIKGLSPYLGGARGISGCTILGTGEVSLILDIHSLAALSESAPGSGIRMPLKETNHEFR